MYPSVQIRALDAGGRGDCLFHSIGAALAKMMNSGNEARRHVLEHLSPDVFSSGKDHTVSSLRCLAADVFLKWEPEAFFDFVLRAVMDKSVGVFEDAWDPKRLLHDAGFGFLENCESVLAFGDNPDGDDGDVLLRLAFTDATRGAAPRYEMIFPLSDGWAKFVGLRSRVIAEMQKLGDNHWGDVRDVRALSEALNIGIFMFCDQLQKDNQWCLYNLERGGDGFPFWVALWYDDPCHFRVAEVSFSSGSYVSFWPNAQVPCTLRQHYRETNFSRLHAP